MSFTISEYYNPHERKWGVNIDLVDIVGELKAPEGTDDDIHVSQLTVVTVNGQRLSLAGQDAVRIESSSVNGTIAYLKVFVENVNVVRALNVRGTEGR